MTRSEITTILADFAGSLEMMADRDEKDAAVAAALRSLCDAIAHRTEQEFAVHCGGFDPREVLARLERESRMRRESGPLGRPPGGAR